jgi:hypothetical protein
MAILGIALLGFLLLAIIGRQAAQALLKGIGVIIGLIVVYLAVGSAIMNQMHPAAVVPTIILTPEQIASDNSNVYIAIFFVMVALILVVRFAFAMREPPGPPRRLGH